MSHDLGLVQIIGSLFLPISFQVREGLWALTLNYTVDIFPTQQDWHSKFCLIILMIFA